MFRAIYDCAKERLAKHVRAIVSTLAWFFVGTENDCCTEFDWNVFIFSTQMANFKVQVPTHELLSLVLVVSATATGCLPRDM